MKHLIFTFFLFSKVFVFSQNPSWPFEIPEIKPNDTVIVHSAISLLYAEKHEQAYWVAYQLLGNDTSSGFSRSDRFLIDKRVSTGSATHQDYLKSGYDRGHLAPAADFSWSEKAMNESFYYSNMSPQVPSFNRGIWKKLETQVRNWADIDSCLYIITGPLLHDSLKSIGPNAVSVPEFYFKVVLAYGEKSKGIAFIIPNEASSANLKEFAITIDSVQKVTGINFFPKLNLEEQRNLEQQICVSCWTWTSTVPLVNNKEKTNEKVDKEVEKENKNEPLKKSVQCVGITKAGKQCGNKTLNSSHRCHLHLK